MGDVRAADSGDLPLLPAIERAADGLFAPLGIAFPPGCVIEGVHDPGPVLVAGRPPVAFAFADELDGRLHLHQLAVHPSQGRRGLGSALLAAVVERARGAGGAVTLTTFRDVPWNAPWYARHGFREMEPSRWGPRLAAQVETERLAGLDRLGPRVVLWLPLSHS
ncbi:MAG TPA: GNAT family N-acetyltransferase [Polyangiaceae bacterium]|nr:GNAT family N-acetyltransferase [Polyangiaceae bacterium]